MIAARPARLRPGPAQRRVQRRAAAPPAASTPSRGTSSSRVASGRVFGAWVDLRAGDAFGTTFTVELEPGVAVFVPRGVGNGYQTARGRDDVLLPGQRPLAPRAAYPALDLADPTRRDRLADPARPRREISEKDRTAPAARRRRRRCRRARPLVLGADGQLGRALRRGASRSADARRPAPSSTSPTPSRSTRWPWHEHDVVLNAAAYTAVDAAETPEGRRTAWAANADGPAALARLAARARLHAGALLHRLRLRRHRRPSTTRTSRSSPLGVYGQTQGRRRPRRRAPRRATTSCARRG